ncbi:MAG: aldo/keto reductase family protein [Chthonomonadetes bacterium]|nr:aldo/keto reductase family protein [Chthonomonadetes bacterium]
MQYRKLGKWGVKVSEVSLGSWLTFGHATDEETAAECIYRAYELGINLFDTANVYAAGRAEEVMGKALKAFRRDSYVLATKVYFPMGDGPNDRGLSRKHIFEQCHASLKRLGTDYIDLYQCHRYDRNTPLEETVRAMGDLIRQGKILYWGVSEWSASQILDAVHLCQQMNIDPPVSNQPHYNMLGREIEKEVLPMCERVGMGNIVFSPLAQGVLTGKYLPGSPPPPDTRAADESSNMFMRWLMSEEVLTKVQKLRPIAERNGLTMAQLALAWCLRQPMVSSVIIGARKVSQIEDNVKASGVQLSPEDLRDIDIALGFAQPEG